MKIKKFLGINRAKLILFAALSLLAPIPFWGIFYISLVPPIHSLVTTIAVLFQTFSDGLFYLVLGLLFLVATAGQLFLAYLIACAIDRIILQRSAPEKQTAITIMIIAVLALLSFAPIFSFRDAGGGSGHKNIIGLISDFTGLTK